MAKTEDKCDPNTLTTENLFEKIGNFGRYQLILLIFANYAILCWSALSQVLLTLLIAEPRWRCVDNSTVCNITGSVGPGEDNYEYRCGIPRQDWQFVDDYTSLVTQFELVCGKSSYAELVYTITVAGSIAGGFIAGILSDKFGRKKTFFASGLVVCGLLLLSSFSQSYMMFAIPAFFIGIGYAGTVSTGLILVVEYAGIKYRSIMANGLWISYALAYMILAGIGYLVKEWRTVTLIISLSGVPALAGYWFVPESFRWLIVKKRVKQAWKTLKTIAKINKKIIDDDNIQLPTFEDESSRGAVYGDIRVLFSSRYVTTTLVVCYTCFVNSMVYSGVNLSAPSVGGSAYFNWFITGVAELFSTSVSIYVLNRFGRKKCIIICEVMASLSALGSVIITLYDKGSTGFFVGKILMSMVLAKFFISISFNGILLMGSELYPTVIRNVAQGTSGSAISIGSMAAAYVNYLIRVHPLLPYGIMGINAFISALFCLILKETRNQPILEVLPEKEEKEKSVVLKRFDKPASNHDV